MPPKTRAWGETEYLKLVNLTERNLKERPQRMKDQAPRIILTGDFNTNKDWRNFEVRAIEDQLNNELLVLTQDFMIHTILL